jgi:hypothetical protein
LQPATWNVIAAAGAGSKRPVLDSPKGRFNQAQNSSALAALFEQRLLRDTGDAAVCRILRGFIEVKTACFLIELPQKLQNLLTLRLKFFSEVSNVQSIHRNSSLPAQAWLGECSDIRSGAVL